LTPSDIAYVYVLGKALVEEHSQNKGTMQGGAEAASYSENALSPGLGFTMCKAQLLSILNLKSSSSQHRNFHGYKVPFEYKIFFLFFLLSIFYVGCLRISYSF
jgi:hypothetical protein